MKRAALTLHLKATDQGQNKATNDTYDHLITGSPKRLKLRPIMTWELRNICSCNRTATSVTHLKEFMLLTDLHADNKGKHRAYASMNTYAVYAKVCAPPPIIFTYFAKSWK